MNRKIATFGLVLFILIASNLSSKQVLAANINITGKDNGATCNSGGTFTPSAVTITSGDTVTFSVPSNDPYAYGIEVHGFPQGSFVVARGGSVTTQPITKNVSFNGTWPSSGCPKGTGTVTVKTTAVSHSPTPTPKAAATATTPAPTPKKSATPKPTPSPSPSPTPVSASTTTTGTPSGSNGFKSVAVVGGGALAGIAAVAVVAWFFILRPRKKVAANVPKTEVPSSQPGFPPSSTPTIQPGTSQSQGEADNRKEGSV